VRFRGYDSDLGGVLGAVTYNRGIDGGRVRLDAASHAASAFVGALRTAGVRVDDGSATGAAPQGAVEVARAQTGTMGAIAEAVNVPSNNFAAEMLLKGLGARFGAGGSTAKGAAVVRDTLDDLGVRPRIADGSGLSRANRTTPRQVVRLLQRIDGQAPIRRAFRSSLAVAGRTGTLRRRMRGTPAASRCRGKTGTLRGVSALVGVCRTRGGRDVAFAFLSNGVNPSSAKRVEDRMVAAVARLQR
jgi:D-alanyl-D-alanine carboxypeptidase/D-alanyl-D-alanine-endopeptidase (penicillin-binding protein 4)